MIMGVMLDTSVLIAVERGILNIDHLISSFEGQPVGISVITAAELLHGVHRADSRRRRLKRQAYVEQVIDLFPIYPFELHAARIYAELWASQIMKGTTIGAYDLIIGATAISLGFEVATYDLRDFGKIEGLTFHQFSS